MRIGLIADVHANVPALEAVVADAARRGVESWICAGDIVGYGPQPNEAAAAVAALGGDCVAGNHDLIAIGELGLEGTSERARRSLEWTREALDSPTRQLLARLPRQAATSAAYVVHGGIGDPERYVLRAEDARAELERLPQAAPGSALLVLGHTHIAMAYGPARGLVLHAGEGSVELGAAEPLLVNPGSVGQARLGPAVARYALLDLDTTTVDFRAVRYDVRAVARELRRAGLPRDSHHPRRPARERLPRPVRRALGSVRRRVTGR